MSEQDLTQGCGKTNRRAFLGGSVLAGLMFAGGALSAKGGEADAQSAPSRPAGSDPHQDVGPGEMPMAELGKVKLSRLMAGGNLLSGWCHQRDLLFVSQLAQAYLTERKQFDTLEWMEEAGINSIMIDLLQIPILKKYRRERGGKMKMVVSVREDWGGWSKPNLKNYESNLVRIVDQGPDLLYLHGGYCDRLVQAGSPANIEFLGKAMDLMRKHGFMAGLGSHALEVPMECDKAGVEPDYYVKTFHHDRYWSATPKDRRKRFCVDGPKSLDHNEFHDNIFCIDPEDTVSFMAKKKQPWIAFKVLAAGAIEPKSGFGYALEQGADILAVGMFDFNIAEDVRAIKQVMKGLKRTRPWGA